MLPTAIQKALLTQESAFNGSYSVPGVGVGTRDQLLGTTTRDRSWGAGDGDGDTFVGVPLEPPEVGAWCYGECGIERGELAPTAKVAGNAIAVATASTRETTNSPDERLTPSTPFGGFSFSTSAT